MSFFSKAIAFFAHPDTPGSGFYLALLPVLSSVGDYFMGSGNPALMAIGGGIAAIYAAANAIGNAVQHKVTAAAPLGDITASSSPPPAPPVDPNVPPPPVGANAVPFGTAKVGPDDLVPPNHIQPEPA